MRMFWIAAFAALILQNVCWGQEVKLTYPVFVKHPGVSVDEKIKCLLQRSHEEPPHFYMEVPSVVCGDTVCRIDTVRIIWDELGEFMKIELPPGVELEKEGGKKFTGEDYKKLHYILKKRHSSLRWLKKEQLVVPNKSKAVDGVTGATAFALSKDDFVPGAVWTSYTLWHWVHCGVDTVIAKITLHSKSENELLKWLLKKDDKYAPAALHELIRRKKYSAEAVRTVLECASTKQVNLMNLITEYVLNAPTKIKKSLLEQLLMQNNHVLRVKVLHAIESNKNSLPDIDWTKVFKQILPGITYQEFNLLLNIFEDYHIEQPELVRQIFEQLKNDNIFIARRAYWFLKKQKLNEQEHRKLEQFFVNHKEFLN